MATAAAANMGRLTHLITNSAIPMPLLAGDIESRGAMLTASVMAQIKGQSRGRFGHVEWQASGLYSPTANWRAREEKILMSHLRPIIAGALPRPEENLAIEAPSKERDNVATINGNVELAAQAS